MKKFAAFTAISIVIHASLPVFAEDERHYLSIVPPASAPLKNTVQTKAQAVTPKSVAPSAAKASPAAIAPASNGDNNGDAQAAETTPPETAAARSFYSLPLEQAVKAYRAAPAPQGYAQILTALKAVLTGASGLRVSPAVLVKDNPYLSDFKPRVIDAAGVRVWSFPKAPDHSRVLLQWSDVHQQVIGVRRRKKVVTTTTVRFQEMAFSQNLNVKDVGIVSGKEIGRHLIVSGDADDGSLSVLAYKFSESGWQESPEFLSQIPSFLSTNVCGRLGFRGADLIFNIGRMVSSVDSNGNKRLLPEAESCTYKYWLKYTNSGYVVAPSVPDEDAFSVVYQFLQAVAQSRADMQKALLVDPRLVSLPKYLGLQGKPVDSSAKVVEMSVPAARGQRFRIINAGKDDIIFDVGKVKNQWAVKAIFVAPPDSFLSETAKYFPPFSRFEQKEQEKKDAQSPDAATGAGAAAAAAVKRR